MWLADEQLGVALGVRYTTLSFQIHARAFRVIVNDEVDLSMRMIQCREVLSTPGHILVSEVMDPDLEFLSDTGSCECDSVVNQLPRKPGD